MQWRRFFSTAKSLRESSPINMLRQPAVAGATHIGRTCTINEDSFLTIRLPGCRDVLLAVADGIGGEEAGEVASLLAIRCLLKTRLEAENQGGIAGISDAHRIVMKGVEKANHTLSSLNARLQGCGFRMGTTLTAAALIDGQAIIVHAGDSRCYWLHGNSLKQLTRDDTWGQEFLDSGTIPEDEPDLSTWHNTLSNCLGVTPCLEVTVLKTAYDPGDRFLLCTDGISKSLLDIQLQELLRPAVSPTSGIESIIRESLLRGGRDNLAAAVAFCDD